MKESKDTYVTKNLYVDLDSIFDTRLPIVYYLDKNLSESIIKDKSYFNRIIDEFDYIDKNIFKVFYKNRNKTLLAYATPTNILRLVYKYYSEVTTSNKIYGNDESIKIYLNIYPYELNIAETHNIISGIKSMISEDIDVSIISMSEEEVTPSWLLENVAAVFMYHGMDWLERHTANFNIINSPMLDVGMMVPAIISGNKKKIKMTEYGDFFEGIEKSLGTLVKLKFLPVKDFSILT